MVYDDEIRLYANVEMRDRLVEAHSVESPLFGIRDKALHILESAGDVGLAMAL